MHVVIIGGGPSGAAVALTLLDAQIPVTIVEQKPFPRYRREKRCIRVLSRCSIDWGLLTICMRLDMSDIQRYGLGGAARCNSCRMARMRTDHGKAIRRFARTSIIACSKARARVGRMC